MEGIWSLRVPNRVKTLLWRAGLDSLPSKANLLKRKVLVDDLCPGYKIESESSFHALWSCTELNSVWKGKFDWLKNLSRDCSSFLEVIQLCQSHKDLIELFAKTVSLIWACRNQFRVGDNSALLWKLMSLASNSLLEFQRASLEPPLARKSPTTVKWLPPPMGWLKVNFDGAIFKEKNLAGIGCIIRNDKGLVMAAFTQFIPLPTSVKTVEVLAVRSTIGFAKELSLDQIILEGDPKTCINVLSIGGWESFSFGHIVKDINFFASAFRGLSFSHTHWLRNRVAHRLARSAYKFPQFHSWMEDIPLDIVSVYFSDLL